MVEYTETINTSYNIPNITVYNLYCDGVQYAFKVVPNAGYVMYDTKDENYETDTETGEEIPVTYYYRQSRIPVINPNRPYEWCAVLESEVPADHIFGGGNNHKVI